MENNNVTLPRISIVVANFNYSKYLADAIISSVNQDYPKSYYDIVFIDDKSTDDSIDKIKSICGDEKVLQDNEHFTISIFSNKLPVPFYLIALKQNGGPSRARNIGINFCMNNGTNLIQILDADDILHVEKLSKLITPILKDPEMVAITYADYLISREDGSLSYESKLSYDYQHLYNGNSCIHSGAMISCLALQKIGYPYYPEDQRVAEDLSLWLKICKFFIAVHIPEPLTIVRSHGMDSTSSVPKEIWNRDFQKAMSYR